ncbi:MAG TPA: DUF3006 domain-containing protein [Blastocatellia bacterium]|jgi:hypothetical protein|nr:DUF3006 domain-containing protein [Blastocatellia bacterium]
MKKEAGFKVEIDRVEGALAVVVLSDDDKVKFNLPVKYLPEGVRDGDHLQVTFKLDEKSRDEQKTRVSDLLKELASGGKKERSDKSDA